MVKVFETIVVLVSVCTRLALYDGYRRNGIKFTHEVSDQVVFRSDFLKD